MPHTIADRCRSISAEHATRRLASTPAAVLIVQRDRVRAAIQTLQARLAEAPTPDAETTWRDTVDLADLIDALRRAGLA